MATVTDDDQVQAQALREYNAGNRAAAAALARELLARQPEHVFALNLLGMIAGQSGRSSRPAMCAAGWSPPSIDP